MYRKDWSDHFYASYNRALAESFERETADIDEQQLADPAVQAAIQQASFNSLQSWYDRPLPELDGQTPDQLIEALEGPDELLAFTEDAAERCDDILPDLLVMRLAREEHVMRPVLRERALAADYEARGHDEIDDELIVPAQLARLLGDWQDLDFARHFFRKIAATDRVNELIADSGRHLAERLGHSVVPELLERSASLLEANRYSASLDYILVFLTIATLTEIDEAIRDRSFRQMRAAFRQMPQRVIPTICIGDLGDGRGVPLLRGWLERHHSQLDNQLFYELLSSIRRLGGETTDLMRFRPQPT
ncbi:MAG: hypothetical protein QM270_07630 [Bacillota bacterium]|nr:hypothetical protein [Bacillota bacterium]